MSVSFFCSIVSVSGTNSHHVVATNDNSPKHVKIEPKCLSIDIENKFAQITASVGDMFIDDETSPTDSLVSSTESDEIISKKNKKKINDSIKDKNLDDISSIILDLSGPLSPGTPTHASNSLSVSDCGRDFLIDDEIADQPGLCFDDNNGNLFFYYN